MNLRSSIALALTLLASAGHAEFDTREHTDLGPVVMLCASEPESGRFDAAWMQWVRENPDADVSAAIRTVLSRAGTLRSMAMPGMRPRPVGERPDPDAIGERLAALARQARR
jgi:hypothetical protein